MLLLPTEPPPKGPPTYNTTNSKPVNGLSPRAYPDKLIQKKKRRVYQIPDTVSMVPAFKLQGSRLSLLMASRRDLKTIFVFKLCFLSR